MNMFEKSMCCYLLYMHLLECSLQRQRLYEDQIDLPYGKTCRQR